MKICFLNRSYWPDQAATGQLLTELAEDLVRDHGCAVTVVAGRALHGTEAETSTGGLVTREVRNGVTIVRANGTRFNRRHFVGRAANYLSYFASAAVAARTLEPHDVVVALTDPPIVGLIARWVASRSRARFVYVSEDVFPEVASVLDDFHSPAMNRALDRTNRYLLSSADAIVALGERMKRRLVEEKGADVRRVRIIHNWADCEAIRPGSKDNHFARVHGLADRFVVMHSGNVGLSQNLEVLIDAARELQGRERLIFVIVGEGAHKAALERRAAGLSNVRFLPYQPKDALSDSFAAADTFLVTLKPGLEGYIVPSKLYGILAAGRPFIAAVDPSAEPAGIAARFDCGVCVPPGDASSLARAIVALQDDAEATRRMGDRARQAALLFDRRAAVRAYFDLFTSVLDFARAA